MMVFRYLKHVLPKSLFGRALLILVVPTVLVQLVAAYIFYERHWENVNRHMSISLAGEIAYLVHELTDTTATQQQAVTDLAEGLMGLNVKVSRERALPPQHDESYEEFTDQLRRRMSMPFVVETADSDDYVLVHVQRPDDVITIQASKKRLVSGTTRIFIAWMAGAATIFLFIAILFLRNQIRPIRQLAEAAEAFGRGMEMNDFRPKGANEVRRAGRAFIIMRERIKRQVTTRTDMLSSISHDLRTPLTRMKLALAMMGRTPEVQDLEGDVTEMEHMVGEYLDFARGVGREEAQAISLRQMLEELLRNYERQNQVIQLHMQGDATINVRPQAFRRCLTNLIDNAFRYGGSCHLHVHFHPEELEIWVDDEGPGIPHADRDQVFRAFTRLDQSRNLQTGGVGLGLTIARDIVLSHGGEIVLREVPKYMDYKPGGLRVVITLPY